MPTRQGTSTASKATERPNFSYTTKTESRETSQTVEERARSGRGQTRQANLEDHHGDHDGRDDDDDYHHHYNYVHYHDGHYHDDDYGLW